MSGWANINFLIVPSCGEDSKGEVNNTIEFILTCNLSSSPPARVTVSSDAATRDFPVLVVVRQQHQVLSWQLPLFVNANTGDLAFHSTSRTLCPDEDSPSTRESFSIQPSTLSVSISTFSPQNVSFTVRIEPEPDFLVGDNEPRTVSISPSAPKLFLYQFPASVAASDAWNSSDTVLLRLDSDDDICMLVSVQDNSCPVYDLEHNIKFEGFWETVDKRGGLNIPRVKFPNGFFIVLVAKSEDRECTGSASDSHNSSLGTKTLTFSVSAGATRRDYVTALVATAALAVGAHLVAWLLLCVYWRRHARLPLTVEAVDGLLDDANCTEAVAEATTPASTVAPDFDDEILGCSDHSSMDETEYDTITEATSERHFYRNKGVLFVSDLARKPPRILQKKSYLYLWHVITVAVFYGLPVVQLVFTYQKVLVETGNQDLCYYNFLCAHPFGLLSDMNHVVSNAGYLVLGILFILLVYRRERWHGQDPAFERQYGIPQHHGLFYAMGAALIMEGVLSASYHVCPNHTNFQFDSSFMYVMAVLCMVKIYQNRHPDINATAYATFGVLAVAICLGMVGILAGSVTFWVGFTLFHLATCLLLTVQIYYMGCWRCDRGLCTRVFRTLVNDFRAGPANLLRPVHKARMVLLILGNLCNWGLAIAGLLHHDKDFATYLLAVFMSNTLLYTLFYIVMKLVHRERLQLHAIAFILFATATWAAAMYFFVHKSISWALTPAQSRHYNQPCRLFHFYDPHDIWHFLSAAAMFFSFMILLTLDDDLTHTNRSKIHVF